MLMMVFGSALPLALAITLAQVPGGDRTVPADVAAKAHPTESWKKALAFTERVKVLGPWEVQHRTITEMVDSVFTRNGWNSEADLFARNVVTQVSALPPWDVRGRIELFTSSVSTRYQLTGQQREALHQQVWHDMISLTTRNFPALLPILSEMIETRAQGRPFTAEQVARWARKMRPLVNRNMEYAKKSLAKFRDTLSPAQQSLLDRDVAAADRRANMVFAQMGKWERGQWTPQDWGLERDPTHAAVGAGSTATPASRARPGRAVERRRVERRPAPSAELAGNQDQWAKHVEQFISRYALDEAQQTSAWSIYRDLKLRADQWRASHADELAELRARVDDSSDPQARQAAQKRLDEQTQPLQGMFAELKDRLENLLTSEQRERGRGEADERS